MEELPVPRSPLESVNQPHDAALDKELSEDPRALQILTTEHWSLLSARGLAYNESFARASMFLAFVSMSFVALALLATANGFTREFLAIAAVMLGFDFLIGILTVLRMMFAALEDTRATFGMNRIRNAYVRIAPTVERFFITGVHDDVQGMMKTVSLEGLKPGDSLALTLSTSGTMVALIDTLIGATLVATILLAVGADLGFAVVVSGASAVVLFVLGMITAVAYLNRRMSRFESRFPTPTATDPTDPST